VTKVTRFITLTPRVDVHAAGEVIDGQAEGVPVAQDAGRVDENVDTWKHNRDCNKTR